jgi:hypothetical protein
MKTLDEEMCWTDGACNRRRAKFVRDEDADAKETEAALESRVTLGAVTLNEMRDALGLDRLSSRGVFTRE